MTENAFVQFQFSRSRTGYSEWVNIGRVRFGRKAILDKRDDEQLVIVLVYFQTDVSPHLIFKNGVNSSLWPTEAAYSEEGEKDSEYEESSQRNGCFSPENIHYPAYFKDAKGVVHPAFGTGVLGFAKNGKFPEVLQHGRAAGMPLYVRCPICQKEFKQKSTLLQHGCIHIESRPYPCGECGKRFRQQSHLTQHIRIHTNEKPYPCVYCGRNFRQRTILNQHLRIHTGQKPYKCGQCGKDFRQKAILDQHTRTHQGERPFCCPVPNCRRRFGSEQEVKKHIDNHMNPLSKGRKTAEGKHSMVASQILSRPQSSFIKPELYFPQCYTPAFNAVAQFAATSPNSDFKPPAIQAQ